MGIVIAIDAGTTGVRSLALNEAGTVVASAYREFTQHFPRPGWVEHDATEIYDAVLATLVDVAGAISEPIAALGITDQRETIVAWDRNTSTPLHNAIVWQDRRTAQRCAELEEDGLLDLVRAKTGLVLDPYFSGSKVEWLQREGGVELGANTAIGTIDSWILWNLTNGATHATDVSNASRTMLYDIGNLSWCDELCELFSVPTHVLPEVRPSSGVFGHTAAEFPLGAGIPIAGIAGDQQSALFGQACFSPGMAKNTYGTGSFVLSNVGPRMPKPAIGLLTTVAWTVPATVFGQTGEDITHYALEGAIFSTGSTVQWLRDGLGLIEAATDIEALALQCDSTDGVYLVPAFTGLGSPYWDPQARGTIVGLTRGSGRPQLARAALESMAFQTRDVLDAMADAGGVPLTELRVDGGASQNQTMLQLVADHAQLPVIRPTHEETTALGAAYLAGLAVGVWSTIQDVTDQWSVDTRVEPAMSAEAADSSYRTWSRAVERSRNWA